MSHAYLTRRATESDHQRRQRAKEDAADFCILGGIGLLALAFVLGIVLSV